MYSLGDLPGGSQPFSYAFAVSADGKTVVGMGTDDQLQSMAYIWHHQRGMRNLKNVLVNDYGLTHVAGWTLKEARAVSMFGTTIAGWGINEDGDEEAWLARLTPICAADLNGDGAVNVPDVMMLFGAMGPCDTCAECLADINGDCTVNTADFNALIGNWGPCP
jgi:uncharacterized membrane protein